FFTVRVPSLSSSISLHIALPIYPIARRSRPSVYRWLAAFLGGVAHVAGLNAPQARLDRRPRRGRAFGRKHRHRRGQARHVPQRADRKSTRLNSSHVNTSYAVFCL